MGWNDFSLAAVGCWYDNEDGTSRQDELRLLKVGEEIALLREPDNPHGRNAVAIYTARGIRVGYVGKERSTWIASKIDRDYPVRAIVQRVKGRDLPDATLGLVMRVNMEGEMPALPQPRDALVTESPQRASGAQPVQSAPNASRKRLGVSVGV